jgi:L-aspartate oxidase
VPAAHYLCGGVVTGPDGRTTLDGLYCAGETAFTGLHGANRLASNSLLEAVVFAHRAYESALNDGGGPLPSVAAWNPGGAAASTEEVVVSQNWDELRRAMWNYVGIVRTDKRLARARARVKLLKEEVEEYYRGVFVTNDLIELRNITTVAELIIECAARAPNRGLHYTTDHPGRDDAAARDTLGTAQATLDRRFSPRGTRRRRCPPRTSRRTPPCRSRLDARWRDPGRSVIDPFPHARAERYAPVCPARRARVSSAPSPG